MLKARTSQITSYFKADIKTVWNIVTNNNDYKWRSDIKKIENIEEGKQWLEYYNEKNYTEFTLVEKTKYNTYIFDMKNNMFTGHWTGYFYPTQSGGTKVIFTENIFIKNPVIRGISYLFWNLKKIQLNYIKDLKIRLKENL